MVGLGGLAIAIFFSRRSSLDAHELAILTVGASFSSLLATWRRGVGVAGAATLYIGAFSLFHFGLLWSLAVEGDSALIAGAPSAWLYGPAVGRAATAAILGLAALTLGCLVFERGRAISRPTIRTSSPERALPVSIAVVAAGVVLLMASLTQGGFAAFSSGSYHDFLEATSGTYFGYGTFLTLLGAGLLIAGEGRARAAGWVVLLCFAAFAIPIGLRGTALFPALAIVYVVGKRRQVSTMWAATAGLGLLGFLAVVKQTRSEGIAGLLSGPWSFSPLETVSEMGYSLYPTVVVQQWARLGETAPPGSTIIAAPVNALLGMLGVPPSSHPNLQLFNVVINDRVGPVGGSPVAEGLYNGGQAFMVTLLFAIGALLALAGRMPNTWAGNAIGLVILVPLFVSIRNSFAPVLVQLGIGMLLVAAAGMSSRRRHPQVGGEPR